MRLENKNLLIILDYGALGGAQRQALGLSKYLTEKRNCITSKRTKKITSSFRWN